MRFKFALPLPHFVLHPLTALTIAAVHVYLAYGHLSKLVAGDVEWVHIWKGFGALFGAIRVCRASITPTRKVATPY
jgi:hypothetical protein